MSVIRKLPYIDSVIADLSHGQKAALLAILNGSDSFAAASLNNLPEDKVKLVMFTFKSGVPAVSGILLQGTKFNTLLQYGDGQEIVISKLDLTALTYEQIDEQCTINELRRCLGPKTIFVENIKEMTDEQLNILNVGDNVVKITGEMGHNYIVSYKQNYHGICLTYCDATSQETQSYDYEDGHWTYNSEDKS